MSVILFSFQIMKAVSRLVPAYTGLAQCCQTTLHVSYSFTTSNINYIFVSFTVMLDLGSRLNEVTFIETD